MSKARIGKIPYKCQQCSKEFLAWRCKKRKFCSHTCSNDASKTKFQEGHKFYGDLSKPNYFKKGQNTGIQNHNWKGGITPETMNLRHSPEYRKWRTEVFKRDDYSCQLCFIRGVYIEANHIKKWSDYPKLRFEINNGITMCRECHNGTKGKEYQYEEVLTAILCLNQE